MYNTLKGLTKSQNCTFTLVQLTNVFIPIREISRALGLALPSLLLPCHALTGCDSTSAVCKFGKIKPLKILRDNQAAFQNLYSLGDSLNVNSSCMSCVESFFSAAFGSKHVNADEARYDIFFKKFKKTDDLPPAKDSLSQHVKRANYQTLIWKSALEHNASFGIPIGHGWEKDGETLIPKLMTKAYAPKSLLVVVSCNCIKLECRGRFSCQKEGLPCIDSYGCGAGDVCKKNLAKRLIREMTPMMRLMMMDVRMKMKFLSSEQTC